MEKNKENIRRQYIRACNDYLYKLMDNWGLYDGEDTSFGWWVGDYVGGVFCCEDDTFINMSDIVYCVDNDIDYEEYTNYLDYVSKCSNYGFDSMNLNAYVKGAPRISDEEFEKLDKLRKELADAINDIKNNFS